MFSRSSVALRWGAVAGATSYDVRVTHGAEEQVFSTNLTSIGVQWTGALSGLAISVRSVIGRGAGEWSAPILQPDRLPSITVRIDRAGAHLS